MYRRVDDVRAKLAPLLCCQCHSASRLDRLGCVDAGCLQPTCRRTAARTTRLPNSGKFQDLAPPTGSPTSAASVTTLMETSRSAHLRLIRPAQTHHEGLCLCGGPGGPTPTLDSARPFETR